MLKLLIVDDHAVFREGLRALLDLEEDFEVIGEASRGDEALAITSHKSNVWLNLVGMPASAFRGDLEIPATERFLFGSDWCFASLDDALAGWGPGTIDEATRSMVLRDNALRLLDADSE